MGFWNYKRYFVCLAMFSMMDEFTFTSFGKDTEFQTFTVSEPKFISRNVSIVDFGAVGDGKTLNTSAFSKAFAAIAKRGGGKVIVPSGIWVTGPIKFVSNLNLYLERGALIRFTADVNQYPFVVWNIKGEKQVALMSPLYGEGLDNVAISGHGIIDGGGEAWRPVKRTKLTELEWKKLVASGGLISPSGDTWWPSREAMDGAVLVETLRKSNSLAVEDYEPAKPFMRPNLLKFIGCRKVLLSGVTFQNSPSWHLNTTLCENVTIHNVLVQAPWFAQNSDALDLESCRNVIVSDSSFDVGDDAITLKSGMDEIGRRIGVPTENVSIQNCRVYHGHGGFVIGSEMSGGIRNVQVDNCSFMGTDTGLRFKSTRGRGGVVEKIYISNIRMLNIGGEAITFDMYYGKKASNSQEENMQEYGPVEVSEGTPRFCNIYINNIICRGAGSAGLFQGLPEMPINEIYLKNSLISANQGMRWIDAENIHMSHVGILNTNGPVISSKNTGDSFIDHLTYCPGVEAVLIQDSDETSKIDIRNTDLTKAIQGIVKYSNILRP